MKQHFLSIGYLFFHGFLFTLLSIIPGEIQAQNRSKSSVTSDLSQILQKPPEAARPWVFWYWMQASVSSEGITTDLEAMKEAGIGGAYLMPIKGPADPPLMEPPVEQLSPAWWKLVQHAMEEADRLGLQLAMHASDGFATAGGPWITPELSMQKVVWTETYVEGGHHYYDSLPQPETKEGYYRDIAVLAFPTPEGTGISTQTIVPHVTSSKPEVDAQFLAEKGHEEIFRSEEPCWIQYAFDQPFTCRSLLIHTHGNNYQAHRLLIEASDDGENFHLVQQLEPPRHGWQDSDAEVTHVITPTTARYFRFRYDPSGSEPGAEDLDAAKWKPVLKMKGITLSAAPRLHQFEGKTGEVWRISRRTTAEQLPDSLCVPKDSIVDLTAFLDREGRLSWEVPPGRWTILRMGHTSTGHTNATGGAGRGLECDKFNPEAVRLQFDRWFGEAFQQVGPALASKVLKIFHVDSWEAGSQNWSPVFREEFQRRLGYDIIPYLPVMAGIPVESANVSERVLYDVRQTIAALVADNFYDTMEKLAHEKGCLFSAENVSPTMTSDGMLHFRAVDLPMGEFWLRSPTHDKPNDILDAISGAHLYGKPIVQAEAFTQLRMAWDEHPAMLKALGDRNYALGINRFVYHVFTHNPWLDRQPGMTLDGVGLYFQRDQTWWKPGRAWVEYAQRCQALLQQGHPVVDIAVFTGEEIPRRALLPDRLVSTFPGLFGEDTVKRESQRLANAGQPLRELPDGVTHSANLADPEKWMDPLHGYAYDSFNKDALLRLARVQDGRIVLPGGASYRLLVLPGARRMSPEADLMSPEVASHLLELVKAGATLLVNERLVASPGFQHFPACDDTLQKIVAELWQGKPAETKKGLTQWRVGKGRVIQGPYQKASLDELGIARDFIAEDSAGNRAEGIAWTHRRGRDQDIYFISNQLNQPRTIEVSLRVNGRVPEWYDPVNHERHTARDWQIENGRTKLPLRLEANGSLFLIFRQPTTATAEHTGDNWLTPESVQTLEGKWQVTFSPEAGGPAVPIEFNTLQDWTTRSEKEIQHYSGTATYTKTFTWKKSTGKNARIWLDLGEVANIAEVKVNGISCGVAWTAPYRVEITQALQAGKNELSVEVTNTWANRLIGDQMLPEEKRISRTTAPYRLEGKPLLKAGLLGPVNILQD